MHGSLQRDQNLKTAFAGGQQRSGSAIEIHLEKREKTTDGSSTTKNIASLKLSILLIIFLFAGILYERWSFRLSARRTSGHYYWDDQGVHFDGVTKKELWSSTLREAPFLVAMIVGAGGLVLRPNWLVSSGLLPLCAAAVLFGAGMLVSGAIRGVLRFARRSEGRD